MSCCKLFKKDLDDLFDTFLRIVSPKFDEIKKEEKETEQMREIIELVRMKKSKDMTDEEYKQLLEVTKLVRKLRCPIEKDLPLYKSIEKIQSVSKEERTLPWFLDEPWQRYQYKSS